MKATMNKLDRMLLAVEKGFQYDPLTGKVTRRGREIKYRIDGKYIAIQLYQNKQRYIILAHQYAWFVMNKQLVLCLDHVNGDVIDNRICNLREATYSINQRNQVNAKGYYKRKNGKFQAQIKTDDGNKYLGTFLTEEEATRAYKEAKLIYHTN